MKAYELLYFVDPTCNEETRAGVMKRIEVALGETGKVDSVEDWGKRRLGLSHQRPERGPLCPHDLHRRARAPR